MDSAHTICTALTDLQVEVLVTALFGLCIWQGPRVFEEMVQLATCLGVDERLRELSVDYRNYSRRKKAQGSKG